MMSLIYSSKTAKLALVLLILSLNNAFASCPFTLDRELKQGGVAYGNMPHGYSLVIKGKKVPLTSEGYFLIGISRDEKKSLDFTSIKNVNQEKEVCTLPVAPVKWKIDKVNGVAGGKVNPKKEFTERIEKEKNITVNARKALTLDFFPFSFIMPINGRISGVYGSQRVFNGHPRSPHSGIDIAAKNGTPIKAVAKGKVIVAYDEMFFSGKVVMIDHGFFINSTYAHLSKINVKEGDVVEQGQVIGEVGSTGRSTGNHLHITINVLGNNINPLDIITKD